MRTFSPDSTVATEGGLPLGEWALKTHLSKESDGWDGIFCCGLHGKHVNESTKCTSNSHLQNWVWCETKCALKLVNKYFYSKIFKKKSLCEPTEQDHLVLKLNWNVPKTSLENADVLHCPEKYLSLCPETFWGMKDESEPFYFLLWLWSPMETATNIYVRQILVALRNSLLLCRSQLHKSRWRFVTLV